MVPQEFYIRNEAETEARGPFNLDQVMSLAEAGQVTAETRFYDATTEQWVAIGGDEEVKEAVFPEKKKLEIRRNVEVATLNKETDSAAPISVVDMLAAAEGRTHDTKDKSDPKEAMARSAKIGTFSMIAALFLSAAGSVLPSVDIVMSGDPAQIARQPLLVLGIIDVALALCLLPGIVAVYPFIRFRAALALGFLGLVTWTQGDTTSLLFVVLGSVGLYFCTICITYLSILIAAILALVGTGGFAWFSLMG
jgi:hypothetical protein